MKISLLYKKGEKYDFHFDRTFWFWKNNIGRTTCREVSKPCRKNSHDDEPPAKTWRNRRRRLSFSQSRSIANQQFVEYTEFGGNLYGLRRSDVEQALASPKICVLIVEQQGRKALKAMYGDEIHCVYMAISRNKAKRRLNKRDGWQKAIARIKADKENGLYDDSGYDCVLAQELSHDEHISEFMKFAESC